MRGLSLGLLAVTLVAGCAGIRMVETRFSGGVGVRAVHIISVTDFRDLGQTDEGRLRVLESRSTSSLTDPFGAEYNVPYYFIPVCGTPLQLPPHNRLVEARTVTLRCP
jgi:hypothetical protein